MFLNHAVKFLMDILSYQSFSRYDILFFSSNRDGFKPPIRPNKTTYFGIKHYRKSNKQSKFRKKTKDTRKFFTYISTYTSEY